MEIDGTVPDCKKEMGCPIPRLAEDEQRIMEIRSRLISLKDIVDSGTILNLYKTTKDDIDILAVIENEIRKMEKKDGRDRQ